MPVIGSGPPVRLETRSWLRTVGRRGPERWLWPVAALGWIALTSPLWAPLLGWHVPAHHHDSTAGVGDMDMPMQHHPDMPMPMHHHTDMPMPSGAGPSWWSELAGHLVMWTAMVLATMLPLIAWNLRQVGLRSPRARRRTATVEVAAGWLGVWLLAGVVVSAATITAVRAGSTGLVIVASVAVAIAWQFTAVRRVAVARCHRTYAPPLGAAARRACVGFGGTLGRDCVMSCWAGMAVMTAAGHQLAVVLPIAWLSWRDRRRPPDRPGTATSVAVLALAGAVALAGALSW